MIEFGSFWNNSVKSDHRNTNLMNASLGKYTFNLQLLETSFLIFDNHDSLKKFGALKQSGIAIKFDDKINELQELVSSTYFFKLNIYVVQ